jgi:hypothetical protein
MIFSNLKTDIMKALKNLLKGLIGLLLLSLVVPYSLPAQGNANNPNRECKTFLFRNLNPRSVTDLHIKFNQAIREQTVRTSEEEVRSNDFRRSEDGTELNIYLTNGPGMGEVPSGGAIEVKVCSEEDGLEIEEWYWTRGRDRQYGEVLNGTVDDNGDRDRANQDRGLIVPSEEQVRRVTATQRLRYNYDINDMHIVTNEPVIPKGLPANLTAAAPTECDCSQEHDAQPCKSLCDGRGDETIYVINLEGVIPDGQEVSLELWSELPFEILQWWWTRNGYPLNVRQLDAEREEGDRPRNAEKEDGLSDRYGPPSNNPSHSEDDFESKPLGEIVPPIIYYLSETEHGETISTGETTGTIALVDVTNPNPYSIRVNIQDAIIKGVNNGQPFKVKDRYQTVPANSTFPVGIKGYCIDVHRQPNPAGESMSPIEEWIIPDEADMTFTEDWKPRNPDYWNVVEVVDDENYVTIPGTDIPLGYEIDMQKYPEEGAALMIEIINRVEDAAQSLSENGVFPGEFRDVPVEEVVQQAVWMVTSELDSSQPSYTGEDFRDRMDERFEEQTGTKVDQLPDEQKEQYENSMTAFLTNVRNVGKEAKVRK